MYDFQKASMWKRVSAALCDLVALGIVAVGLALLFSTLLGYDGRTARLEEISEAYESEYGVDFDITESDYEKLTEGEKAQFKLARDKFSADPEANYVYGVIVSLTFAILTLSILLASVLLEFVVPLLFGNGQTLGKKVFGVAVMREDCVRLSPLLLFTRALLGKYTVETMIPVLIILMMYWGIMGFLGTIILLCLLGFQLVLFFNTREHRAIHDKLSHTVVVDFASQMIFDSTEAMLAYKQRIHEAEAARGD